MSSTEGSTLEFMKGKWREWFKALDVDQDGTLSRKDSKKNEEAVENYYRGKVDEKTLESITEGFRMFWDDFIFGRITHKDSVTVDEFVACNTKEYQRDREGFISFVRRMITQTCRVIDADHNGFISLEEFMVIYHAFGYSDDELGKNLFQAFKPTKDGISVADYADSWIDVAIGEDPKKANIPIEAFLSKVEK